MLVIKILRVITLSGVCFRQGYQLPLIRLFSILILGVALNACAGLYLSRTVSWDEDILQLDGRVLSIHGTETYGPDEWGRSGRGPMQEQTIQFSHDGQQVKWESSDRTPYVDNPVVLDIINHTPVLILSVRGWPPVSG